MNIYFKLIMKKRKTVSISYNIKFKLTNVKSILRANSVLYFKYYAISKLLFFVHF